MSTMTLTTLITAPSTGASGRAAGGAAARRPGVRLTRRGRLVVLAAALLLMLGVLVSLSAATQAGSTAVPVSYAEVVVQPGDTLWGLAQEVAPGADPRATVTALIELNDLDGAEVGAGQRLKLPVFSG